MNTFRVGFLMERMTPGGITGAIDETYFKGLENVVKHITSK
jgi:endoglucanase